MHMSSWLFQAKNKSLSLGQLFQLSQVVKQDTSFPIKAGLNPEEVILILYFIYYYYYLCYYYYYFVDLEYSNV
jgi:hypothetical protein